MPILKKPVNTAPKARQLKESFKLKKRAEKITPCVAQTFSKGPTQFVQGVAPIFLERADGSHIWDVDGNEYIDYPMALGPIILGHNYGVVNEAAIRQLKNGIAFSLPHRIEVEVAELLAETIPCAEMSRFGKNGSDATSAAIRVARAHTGRELVACCGYHGWHDWYIGTTTRNQGVPESARKQTLPFVYNDIKSLEKLFSENPGRIAAVILEPIGVIEPKDDFLQKVQALARKEGAVLIFDEVVTGFRVSMGGAQEYYKVTPDLACFGKAMGNGFPISAVVGPKDLMKIFDEIFVSSTFAGEAVSLAASKAVILEMKKKKVIDHLWKQGKRLKEGYNALASEYGLKHITECNGLPPRTLITFKDSEGKDSVEIKSLFQQECLKRGILFSGGQNICFSHSDSDINATLKAYRAAMEILAHAVEKNNVLDRLEGPPVQAVFRRA